MSSVQYSFPPESYSAVYNGDASTNANVICKCPVGEGCEQSSSPPAGVYTPPSSIFSCFHCAFQNGIKVIRKEKRKKDRHAVNHKAIGSVGRSHLRVSDLLNTFPSHVSPVHRT